MMRRKRAARQGWERGKAAGHRCGQHPGAGSIPVPGTRRMLRCHCLHVVGARVKHEKGLCM